jgi:hypothetical protein
LYPLNLQGDSITIVQPFVDLGQTRRLVLPHSIGKAGQIG